MSRAETKLAPRGQVLCAAAMLVAALTISGRLGASPYWMTGAALRANFAGTTIDGIYIDKREFREQYFPDGRLDYKESTGTHWTGHWSVIGNLFCTIYDVSGTGGCFRVHRVGDNCYEFYFQTRTEEEARRAPPDKPSWTAQAWRTNAPATCQEKPVA